MTPALRATALGKRYGRQWALRDCTLTLPAGRVTALVGPNGAGKTTLLQLAVGLTHPTRGTIEVCGLTPRVHPKELLPLISFVAQEQPLYQGFTVAEMLTVGRKLNRTWNDGLAHARLMRLGIPLGKRIGALSGGQRSQVALALALAKRPRFLVLDEPVAALDPLARRAFLQTLMEAAAEDGLAVLLSSHIIADLERVCDYLIILCASQVHLAGDIDEIVQAHKLLVGPRRDPAAEAIARVHRVIQERHTARQTLLLVHTIGPIYDPSWEVRDVALEDIVLAYLDHHARGTVVRPHVREEVPA